MKQAAQTPAALSSLGAWVAGLTYDAIPETTRSAARYQLLNMLAAAHAARSSTSCDEIERAVAHLAGSGGRATVFSSGRKLPPVEAAIVNAACSIAHDFDDIIWTGHTCHSAVFASLAVAEHEGRSTKELVTAIVAANEIAGRVAAACYLGPLNGQMVTCVHLVGAAASASKLLRLDATHTTHALAVSLAQPNFPLQPGFFHTSSKLLAASTPTAVGIRAAYFAREGVTGEPGLLEHEKGFLARFAYLPLPRMLGGLGEFWTTETLTIKTYPGCHYFQTSCAALEELQGRHPKLTLRDVDGVAVDTTKLAVEVAHFAGEYDRGTLTPVSVDFDLSVALSVLLHAGRFTAHEHGEAWLAENTEALRQWQKKIRIRHDPALTLRVFEGARGIEAGRELLRSLSTRDLVRVLARYRAEYRSDLAAPGDLWRWLKVGFDRAGRKRAVTAPAGPSSSAVPLYFPGRVTLRLADGTKDSAQVDLPPGSYASPGIESVLRRKFLTETGGSLGERGASEAFELGLQLESVSLERVVARFARPPSA